MGEVNESTGQRVNEFGSDKSDKSDDRILVIDDFLARGNTAQGIIELANQAGCKIAGFGFVIEKTFQNGRKLLIDGGYRVESLAQITALEGNKISF